MWWLVSKLSQKWTTNVAKKEGMSIKTTQITKEVVQLCKCTRHLGSLKSSLGSVYKKNLLTEQGTNFTSQLLADATHPADQDIPVSSPDRQNGRAIQPNAEADAEEGTGERRNRLGQTTALLVVCLPRGPTSFYWVHAIWAPLWASGTRTLGCLERVVVGRQVRWQSVVSLWETSWRKWKVWLTATWSRLSTKQKQWYDDNLLGRGNFSLETWFFYFSHPQSASCLHNGKALRSLTIERRGKSTLEEVGALSLMVDGGGMQRGLRLEKWDMEHTWPAVRRRSWPTCWGKFSDVCLAKTHVIHTYVYNTPSRHLEWNQFSYHPNESPIPIQRWSAEMASWNGIIEPCEVNDSKKDKSIRLCRNTTLIDAYPMLQVDELLDKLGGAKFISTLDLQFVDTGKY